MRIENLGILFSSLISAIVAGVAIALAIFLFKGRGQLTSALRAYAWFWATTALVWLPSAGRYLLIGLGDQGPWVHRLDVVMQTGIFLSGPPLVAYLALGRGLDRRLAAAITGAEAMLSLVAIWFMVAPDGLTPQPTTFFTAETLLNPISLNIFTAVAAVIAVALLDDLRRRLQEWRRTRNRLAVYDALYSAAILIYLLLGSIEQIGLVTDRAVVIFRLSYAAAFLAVYLIFTEHTAAREQYLIEDAPAGADGRPS